MRKHGFAFIFAAVIPLLLLSCATGKAARQSIDPIAALSYSSEGAEPAAFAVIPSSFVLPALEELASSGALEDGAPAMEFLGEFFRRADCVFASIMRNGQTGALFCRVIAIGKFPTAIKMMLTPSRGWQKKGSGGMDWFEPASFAGGMALRAAVPASGVILAEIDIAPPANDGGEAYASSSMADFIAATTSKALEPQVLAKGFGQSDNGEGAAFFAALNAARFGAANAPFAFYAPDFNLFARSCLPAAPGLPLAGPLSAILAIDGFSLPLSSIELTVANGESAKGGGPVELLTVRAASPAGTHPGVTRAAAFIVQLAFPGDKVAAENGAITVVKELPLGRSALAVLSFFLLS